jgi:hypothetical protein
VKNPNLKTLEREIGGKKIARKTPPRCLLIVWEIYLKGVVQYQWVFRVFFRKYFQ